MRAVLVFQKRTLFADALITGFADAVIAGDGSPLRSDDPGPEELLQSRRIY
jgi:hypothetical protein